MNIRRKLGKESGFDFSKNLDKAKLKNSNDESAVSKDVTKPAKKPFAMKLKELKLKKLDISKKSVD